MTKKYYCITNSTEKEIGRDYPQLHCLSQPYAHSMSAWEFPAFTPRLNFELYKTAKITDVLSDGSISGHGFLMNEKVKEIFTNFKLIKHQYFEANVLIPKTEKNLIYYWLHLCQPEIIHQLDYKKSIFYETEWEFRKEKIEINSYEHYKELKAKDKNAKFGVELDEIYITENFDMDLDIFVFLPFSNNIYISERMKQELIINSVSGLTYEEANEIKF